MVEGDKWELTIPSELAYGERGSPPKIPGDSTLIFQIEMLEIKGDKVEAMKCNPETGEDCNEKEQGYVTKMKKKTTQEVKKELDRLTELSNTKMKPELIEWIKRRVHILKQMVEQPKKEEEL